MCEQEEQLLLHSCPGRGGHLRSVRLRACPGGVRLLAVRLRFRDFPGSETAGGRLRPPYLKTSSPRLPRPSANGSARSPSANGRAPPRNPARACQQQLRPSRDSPSPSARGAPWRGWAGLQGGTRRRDRPSGTPALPSGTPARHRLRDPQHRPQGPSTPPSGTPAPPSGTPRHRPQGPPAPPSGTPAPPDPFLPAPAAVTPRKPSPTLSSARGSPCRVPCWGRRAQGVLGALRAPLWEQREKTARCLRETRSSDPCPPRGAGERV